MFEILFIIAAIVVLNILYKMGSALYHHKRVYKAPRSTILYDVLAVVSFLFGIAVLYFAIIININTLKVTEWNPHACIIEKMEFDRVGGRSSALYVKPQYSYHYEGIAYVGKRYRSLRVSISRDDRDAITRKFPVSREAICYIDPHNPEQSVLLRDMHGGVLGQILGNYGISLFCFVPVILYFRKRRH